MDKEIIVGEFVLTPYKNKQGEVKSFIVTGNTYKIRKELKNLGGAWGAFVKNPFTNKLGVWIFSLSKMENVTSWLADNEHNINELSNDFEAKKGSKKNKKKGEDSFSDYDRNQIENYFNNYEIIFEKKHKLYEYNTLQHKIKNNKIIIQHTFDIPNTDVESLIKAMVLTEIKYNSNRDMKKVFEMIKSLFLKIQLI